MTASTAFKYGILLTLLCGVLAAWGYMVATREAHELQRERINSLQADTNELQAQTNRHVAETLHGEAAKKPATSPAEFFIELWPLWAILFIGLILTRGK